MKTTVERVEPTERLADIQGTDEEGSPAEAASHQVHSFSRTLAKQYGVNAAIVIAYLANRIKAVEEKRKDNRGFFISIRGLAEHYPYLGPSAVAHAIATLRREGVLRGENHNQKKYDRTLWYSFVDPEMQKNGHWDPIKFNVHDAIKYGGVAEAVILGNIIHWVRFNRKSEPGYTWHRFSSHKLARHLPFSQRTISRALKNLVNKGAVELRKCPGFYHAAEYRVLDDSRVQDQSHEPKSEMHEPIPNIHEPTPEMHEPNCKMHEPKPGMHEPNPNDYTILKDPIRMTSLERFPCEDHVGENTFINPLAAPSGVCACSQTHFSQNENKEKEEEVVNPSDLPIPGSAADSEVKETEPLNERMPADRSILLAQQSLKRPPLGRSLPSSKESASLSSEVTTLPSVLPAPVLSIPAAPEKASGVSFSSSSSAWVDSAQPSGSLDASAGSTPTGSLLGPVIGKARSSSPFAKIPWSTESTAEERAKYEERKRRKAAEKQAEIERARKFKQWKEAQYDRYLESLERFASPYSKKEAVSKLSAEEKVRVLRAAINSRLKVGGWNQNLSCPYHLKLHYDQKGLDLARQFFQLNPALPVYELLMMLDECCDVDRFNEKPEGGFDEYFYERRAMNLAFFLKHLRILNTKLQKYPLPPDVVYLDEAEDTEANGKENPVDETQGNDQSISDNCNEPESEKVMEAVSA